MKGFTALLRLQLLSRLADWKPRHLKARFAEKKAKSIGMIFAYLFLFVWVLGFAGVMEYIILDSLAAQGMADLLLTLVVMISMMSTLILAFFFIMSTLYFGRDSLLLASLPVTSRTVLAAKLTQVYLSETGFSALLILPACVLYGIRVGAGAGFYLRMVLVLLGAAVLPIVIVTFLSTILIRFSALWKRREMVATIFGIGFLIVYMAFSMQLGGMMPEQPENFLASFFLQHQARIQALSGFFPPAGWAAQGLMGDWAQLALFLLVCALAAIFTVWVLGDRYRKLSLMQSESPVNEPRARRKENFGQGTALRACCLREIRQLLRVPTYATNALPTALMPLLMVVMLYISLQNAFEKEGMILTHMLASLDRGLVLAVLTAVLAFMAGINPALSSAVTREGKGHALLSSLPLNARTAVMAKMLVGFGISLLGCVPAAIFLMAIAPVFWLEALLALAACALFCYASGAIALMNDVIHPKLNWLTETEAMKQTTGSLIGILVSWGLLIVLGIGSYALLSMGVQPFVYAAVLLGTLGLMAGLSHRCLMKAADQKYFLN